MVLNAGAERYAAARARTLSLVEGLSAEDMQVQSMPDASPVKWHLAHTSWFFETFILTPLVGGYRPFDLSFSYLFNSYYEAIGPRHPRSQRGLITRPSLAEVMAYRAHVDTAMMDLLEQTRPDLLDLGLAHEEQHQELILMDLKHAFWLNPLEPSYNAPLPAPPTPSAARWEPHSGGLMAIGHAGDGFAFDNEGPRHQVWLEPFEIADRLVTCGEWQAFIADGGYENSRLWLSDGWSTAQAQDWNSPGYWRLEDDGWTVFTLGGRLPVDPTMLVKHVSFYEADAFARWAGARLPTEAEWETAALTGGLRQVMDEAWQWTASAYASYPGFRPATDATGEYNGKFMSGQMTLRGGASITPPGHSRLTYRNFFPPAARWAFSGVRLAR